MAVSPVKYAASNIAPDDVCALMSIGDLNVDIKPKNTNTKIAGCSKDICIKYKMSTTIQQDIKMRVATVVLLSS